MSLAHEEQQIIAVDAPLLLEQEVSHEQVRPVRGPLQHHEPRVCNKRTNVMGWRPELSFLAIVIG